MTIYDCVKHPLDIVCEHVSGPDWIDIVLARADELRAKGVLSIGPDSATFAPAAPVEPVADKDDRRDTTPEPPVDVFNDPNTYPSGRVPGWDLSELDKE